MAWLYENKFTTSCSTIQPWIHVNLDLLHMTKKSFLHKGDQIIYKLRSKIFKVALFFCFDSLHFESGFPISVGCREPPHGQCGGSQQ